MIDFPPILLAALLGIAAATTLVVDRRSAYAPVAAATAPGVTWAIARVEGWRLLRHPFVWVGLAAGLAGFPYGNTDDWMVRWGLSGIFLGGLTWGAFVVVHTAVARDRRSRMDELAASLPAGPANRVPAHMLSLLWVLVPVTVLWAGYLAWRLGVPPAMRITSGARTSYVWEPSVAELAQGPVMVLVVLLLAVAAGTWWRHPIAGLVVPLLLFFSPLVWMLPLVVESGPYFLHTAGAVESVPGSHLAWHYLHLAGLGGLAVTAALLRRGARLLWGGLALAATVALWGGFFLRQHPWWGL